MPGKGSAGPRELVTGSGSENIKIALSPLKVLDVLDCVCINFYGPGAGRHCPDVSYTCREVPSEVECIKSRLLGVIQLVMLRIFPLN